MEKRDYFLNVKILRQVLIAADDVMHFIVATTLLVCAALILFRTIPNLLHPDTTAILHVLNDVLLALIIMELMWPIVRFLRREPFSINPFLYIGIISSIRRILMIEAEHSFLSRLHNKTAPWADVWPALAEVGANVGVIMILAVALRVLCGQGKIESDTK
jgi:uncharacterized membrane protein (DUF373 family)